MQKWVEVVICKKCGNCYDFAVPRICEKCCSVLLDTVQKHKIMSFKEFIKLTENSRFGIAKKGLFKWKTKEQED